MITLHTFNTPNGHKIAIALEEMGLPYTVKVINTFQNEQFAADFLALNPNAKIPVIHDSETGETIWESNAILLYLAEKSGQLLPKDPALRHTATQLLFFQAANVGPMFGQRAFFTLFAPERPASVVQRYTTEGARLEAVMETLIGDKQYFLGEYSIVDIAFFGWINAAIASFYPIDAYPKLSAWFQRVAARPAVQRGITIPAPLIDFTPFKQKLAA